MGNPIGEPSLDRTGTAQVMRPRVFIVSDVRLLRDGLVLCPSQQPSVVVGTADLAMSPRHIAELRPDVLRRHNSDSRRRVTATLQHDRCGNTSSLNL